MRVSVAIFWVRPRTRNLWGISLGYTTLLTETTRFPPPPSPCLLTFSLCGMEPRFLRRVILHALTALEQIVSVAGDGRILLWSLSNQMARPVATCQPSPQNYNSPKPFFGLPSPFPDTRLDLGSDSSRAGGRSGYRLKRLGGSVIFFDWGHPRPKHERHSFQAPR